jgi:hypothetical protein
LIREGRRNAKAVIVSSVEIMSPHLLINGWFWGQATNLPTALSGWKITMLVPVQSGRPQGSAPADDPPAPAGTRIMLARMPSYARGAKLVKLAWEQRVFPTACRQLNADVAFVPYWGSPIRPPCPTLVTIHDLIPMLLDDYASKLTARA